jgi:hypothetical protein
MMNPLLPAMLVLPLLLLDGPQESQSDSRNAIEFPFFMTQGYEWLDNNDLAQPRARLETQLRLGIREKIAQDQLSEKTLARDTSISPGMTSRKQPPDSGLVRMIQAIENRDWSELANQLGSLAGMLFIPALIVGYLLLTAVANRRKRILS